VQPAAHQALESSGGVLLLKPGARLLDCPLLATLDDARLRAVVRLMPGAWSTASGPPRLAYGSP